MTYPINIPSNIMNNNLDLQYNNIIYEDEHTVDEDIIPDNTQYQLDCIINQSIEMAKYTLINRPVGLLNNIIKIDGRDIDMYEHLIVNDNFKNGEFSLVALAGNENMWFARKTHEGLIQYYNFTSDDSFSSDDLFSIFIRGYKQRSYI
jgi:hypothetical protein